METKQRLTYIDVMRGLAIVMVVVNHVIGFSFGINLKSAIGVWSLTQVVQIPLFFFVSGFCAYNGIENLKKGDLFFFVKSKFFVYVIAPIIFLFFYVHFDFRLFIQGLLNEWKFGYWFTISLYTFILLSIIIKCFCRKWLFYLSVFSLLTLLFVILLNTRYCCSWKSTWMDALGMGRFSSLVYFVVGLWVKREQSRLHQILQVPSVVMVIVLGSMFSGAIIYHCHHASLLKFASFVFTFLAIISIYHITRESKSFWEETQVGQVLQYVGQNTLPIYFIHYFFLKSGLEYIGLYLENHPSPLLLVLFSFTFGSLIILLSIMIGKCISSSNLLKLYLFGKK